MAFYQSIVDYYEDIFPLNKAQIEFIKTSFDNTSELSLLDIGCGTGSLSLELAKLFSNVVAIDLDKAMLDKANEKNDRNVIFQKLNMLDIETACGNNTFDAVVCFGNTLVHLGGPGQIMDFFRQARNVLKPKGKFMFQIINYERIIAQRINGLPTIENHHVKFVRNYRYHQIQHKIDFETILTLKKTGETIENTISLYPLRKNEITEMLNQLNFNDIKFFGNFRKEVHTINSIPLIVEASI